MRIPPPGSWCLEEVKSSVRTLPGSLDRLKGIRRLFLPHVGMRGSVKHLFEEFQNSLWDRRENESRESHHSRLDQIAHGARQRKALLPGELQSLREVLCELLSEESCGEWLGFNDLTRPNTLPQSRVLANLVRQPDWTDAENIHKLRMYRAAAFVDCLRPDALDWETPSIPDMEWALEFIALFTRPGISVEDQIDLIDDLSRPHVQLQTITRTTRGPRLELSASELRYVWETRDLSHEARAMAWDNRIPKPFQPLDRSNVEMYRDKELRDAWRSAVNRLQAKAKLSFSPDSDRDERELN
jgi:hypothetical protein